jgi:hypothetical protein
VDAVPLPVQAVTDSASRTAATKNVRRAGDMTLILPHQPTDHSADVRRRPQNGRLRTHRFG